jgi:hypothetical protein
MHDNRQSNLRDEKILCIDRVYTSTPMDWYGKTAYCARKTLLHSHHPIFHRPVMAFDHTKSRASRLWIHLAIWDVGLEESMTRMVNHKKGSC